MRIFDDIIKSTESILPQKYKKVYKFNEGSVALEGEKNELILSKEAAFELGEEKEESVSYTVITSNVKLVTSDEVIIYGKDLQEIKENTPFARITLIRTDNIDDLGEQAVYNIIKGIEMIQYNISPKGYMIRASALSNLERVRVSNEAIKSGLTLEKVGNLFIKKYKTNKYVKAVKIIFITLADAPYKELNRIAKTTDEITRAMNHIISDLKIECKACEWKPVCDEVDGMKEMHNKYRSIYY